MRNIMSILAVVVGLVIGYNAQYNTIVAEAKTNVVSVTGVADYQPDGDVVVIYSDDSCILYNDDEYEYTMWIPETEDYEHNYDSYEDLMYAIERYHSMNNRVVTDIVYANDDNISALNPYGFTVVAEELDKIEEISGAEILDLLARTELEIIYDSSIIETEEDRVGLSDDRMIFGFYDYYYNDIVMRQDSMSIQSALLHEIGHALDYHLGLAYNEVIIDSYIEGEVEFTNADNSDYFYSSLVEYIAESIAEYYNGTLDEDTVMYQELDYILGE